VRPNFVLLDSTNEEIARLVTAMLRARDAAERRSWSHPAQPVTEEWWQDVLADPRARRRERRDRSAGRSHYTLADETRAVVLVACDKCYWRAAFSRRELIARHGAEHPMPDLLVHLARPDCPRLTSPHWDRCGVKYVDGSPMMVGAFACLPHGSSGATT
jgi:hypothetical protein